MIRLLKENDTEEICEIVNYNWKTVYSGYVNQKLLTEVGCLERKNRMKKDFFTGRLLNYVYECNGHAVGLLSMGDAGDSDKKGEFEIYRIYVSRNYKNRGIGTKLLQFAEEEAFKKSYKEIVIWAFKENTNAISFYIRNGYVIDKEDYLCEPYLADAIRFNKKILI